MATTTTNAHARNQNAQMRAEKDEALAGLWVVLLILIFAGIAYGGYVYYNKHNYNAGMDSGSTVNNASPNMYNTNQGAAGTNTGTNAPANTTTAIPEKVSPDNSEDQ